MSWWDPWRKQRIWRRQHKHVPLSQLRGMDERSLYWKNPKKQRWLKRYLWRKENLWRIDRDPPPLKWSDLRYVFDIQEDCNGKEAIQA